METYYVTLEFVDHKASRLWQRLSAESLVRLEDFIMAGSLFKWETNNGFMLINPEHVVLLDVQRNKTQEEED